MKVKGRSENVIRLCREVEYRLPKHPLFDNFRKGLKELQKKTKSKLIVTVINDLPQDKKYVSYSQLLSQFLGKEVASSVIRTNIYLNHHPTLDFKVTFPSAETYTYSKDKRYLLERFLPDKLEAESFGEAIQHIWKKYPATEDFYPLLCTLLSYKSPAPGLKIEILSPTGIENVTLLFPLGNDVSSGQSYWKNFLQESLKADKIKSVSKQQDSKALVTESDKTNSQESEKPTPNSSQDQSQDQPHKSSKEEQTKAQSTKAQSLSQSQNESSDSSETPTDGSKEKTSTKSKTKSKSAEKTATNSEQLQSNSNPSSEDETSTSEAESKPQEHPTEYAQQDVVEAKFTEALDETNVYLVLTSIDELLTHNFLGLLGRSHPLLSKNTIVVLEGDSHGLPGQQLNDNLSLSLGTSSPLWMYYRSADAESFASDLRSFVNGSTRKLEDVYITGMACTELELAAKDLKKMIDILKQEKETVMSDNITPLDDYFNYYFSQPRLNDLISKRVRDFKENFPKEKAKILDFVSGRINAAITSEELMSILDDHGVRQVCEYQYLTVHQFYLDRQRKLRDNFNLQLARLYSEFEANYHVDPLELELQFEKEDPIYRYKVSFDIFERLLNVLMKSTSDLEQAKAHMMNSVLAKFHEDYTEMENYYVYHFRKSMLIMEQSVQKIRKEYHKFYRDSIDRKSEAFIRKVNGLESELNAINDTLDMLRHSPIPNADID